MKGLLSVWIRPMMFLPSEKFPSHLWILGLESSQFRPVVYLIMSGNCAMKSVVSAIGFGPTRPSYLIGCMQMSSLITLLSMIDGLFLTLLAAS